AEGSPPGQAASPAGRGCGGRVEAAAPRLAAVGPAAPFFRMRGGAAKAYPLAAPLLAGVAVGGAGAGLPAPPPPPGGGAPGRRTSARGVARQALALVRAAGWRFRHGPGSPKTLLSGGTVIALIGPEASGKSTLVAETTEWLAQAFRVSSAHLGKPPSAWLTLLPNLPQWLARLAPPGLGASLREAGREEQGPNRPGLLFQLRAVLLAWDRRSLAVRLSRKAAQGWLVVCDRYPSAVVGAADSARLAGHQGGAEQGWLRA